MRSRIPVGPRIAMGCCSRRRCASQLSRLLGLGGRGGPHAPRSMNRITPPVMNAFAIESGRIIFQHRSMTWS